VAVLGGASYRLENVDGTCRVLVDNKLVAEIGKRHLPRLAAESKGRKAWRRSKAEAVATGGDPSPGQGGSAERGKRVLQAQTSLDSH
jgi:hypothetical protein